MVRNRAGRFVMFAVFGAFAIVAFGFGTMSLWNWLMPGIFGLPVLTFWQALGLLALSWILFGGRRGWGHHGGSRWEKRRWIEKWEKMTPDEKEAFRKKMGERCGRWGQEKGDVAGP